MLLSPTSPSLSHFSNSLLGEIHLCHLHYTDCMCSNTASGVLGIALLPCFIPRLVIYGYLSLLIPVQFPDHFWAVGDWGGNPRARRLADLLHGLWPKCSNFYWNWAWNLPSCLKNIFALSSLKGKNTDYCPKNNLLFPIVILVRLWYAIRMAKWCLLLRKGL